MTKAFTASDLRAFGHVLLETSFDLMTSDAYISPEWCRDPAVRSAITADYDFCLRRMGVADAVRPGLVRDLDTRLQGDQPVPLCFRLSQNTWVTLAHLYSADLAERWPNLAA